MKKGLSAFIIVSLISLQSLIGCTTTEPEVWGSGFSHSHKSYLGKKAEKSDPIAERSNPVGRETSLERGTRVQVREAAYPGAKEGMGTRSGAMFGGF